MASAAWGSASAVTTASSAAVLSRGVLRWDSMRCNVARAGCDMAATRRQWAWEPMQFCILGPLDVAENGHRIDLGGPRQRALLALLLLNANEVVIARPADRRALGGGAPAERGQDASGQRLEAARIAERTGGCLRRTAPAGSRPTGTGYLLRVEPGELDADRFRSAARGGQARSRAAGSRGPPRRPFARVSGSGAARRWPTSRATPSPAPRSRVWTSCSLAGARGAHRRRPRARSPCDAHRRAGGARRPAPAARAPAGQLMLALYRSDRQAEALHVYQDCRLALAEELGLEPSQSLRRLERQILEQDPALAPPPAASRADRRARRRGASRACCWSARSCWRPRSWLRSFMLVREGGAESARRPGGCAGRCTRSTSAPASKRPASRSARSPSNIAAGEGAIWVHRCRRQDDLAHRSAHADPRADLQHGLDPDRRRCRRGRGLGRERVPRVAAAGQLSGERVPPRSADGRRRCHDHAARAPSAHGYFQGGGFNQQRIAVTAAAVWAVNPDQTVSRIDPRTNRRVAAIEDVQAADIAAAGGEVWVIGSDGVIEIDPRTNAVVEEDPGRRREHERAGPRCRCGLGRRSRRRQRLAGRSRARSRCCGRSRSSSGCARSRSVTARSGRRTRSPTRSTGSLPAPTRRRSSAARSRRSGWPSPPTPSGSRRSARRPAEETLPASACGKVAAGAGRPRS